MNLILEKTTEKLTIISILIIIVTIPLNFFSFYRNYFYSNFPNIHLIGYCLYVITTFYRFYEARKHIRSVRNMIKEGFELDEKTQCLMGLDSIAEEEYYNPTPHDFSDKKYNIIYIVLCIISILIIC